MSQRTVHVRLILSLYFTKLARTLQTKRKVETPVRIVLIEDNESLAKGISYVLNDAGHAVDIIGNGTEADAFLKDDGADLIVLDINLPGMDGIEILKRLRGRGDHRPVLLLTAKSATQERITGLDSGADDYLVKPFEMEELTARLRALSRRRDLPMVETSQFGQLVYDPEARQLSGPDGLMELPRRELAAFETMFEAGGRTVSKAQLLDRIYGTGTDVEEKVVEVYMSRLRKRLAPFGVEIRVRRGLGYMMQETPV